MRPSRSARESLSSGKGTLPEPCGQRKCIRPCVMEPLGRQKVQSASRAFVIPGRCSTGMSPTSSFRAACDGIAGRPESSVLAFRSWTPGPARGMCGQDRKTPIASKRGRLLVVDGWVAWIVQANRPRSANGCHAGGQIAADAGHDQLFRLCKPRTRRRGSRGACRACATCEHKCNQQSRGGVVCVP